MAAGDLTDLATAKIAAGIPSSSNVVETDTALAALITAISSYVPSVIERSILADNYLELYEGNGKDKMLLRERPVLLVSSISWRGQTITNQIDPIAAGSGIFTDGRNACLSGMCFPRGEQIRIAYSAGYIDVPADLSYAVAELVAEAYARRTHVGETSRSQNGQTTISFDAKSMHAAITDKLSGYRRGAPC
jgi:hypothetical protein